MDHYDYSGIAGSISLACWVVVLAPQFLENYSRRSSSGVSLLFIFLWFIGDALSLIGALVGNLIPTVLFLSLYFMVSDAALIAQILYYSKSESDSKPQSESESDSESQSEPLLHSDSHSTDSSSPHSHSYSFLHSILFNICAIILVILTGFLAWFIYSTVNPSHPTPPAVHNSLPTQIFGWSSALLYLFARIPQIVKNYKKKSCKGLSFLFLAFSTIGNLSYAASILLASVDKTYILANLSWLVGSLGTISTDVIIYTQFIIYSFH